MLLKSIKLMLLGLLVIVQAQAVIPAGYYNGTDGLSKNALKTKLFNIVKDHSSLSYSDLWTAFQSTDKRTDGKVWDIYSNSTSYVFITSQCGNYSGEGSCYNREHSFPKSWFGGEVAPMYTDLYHMYPSDGYINGVRSNYPFGNVSVVSKSSNNGYSLLGTSTESGSTLTVFEPADELKGDMARTYFYMVTRYENLVAGWKTNDNTEMLSGNTYPALSAWAITVLLEWSRLDPVSTKERSRNELIYTNFQHNRNPYIDFPSLAEYVWGDSTTYAFHPSKYVSVPSVNKDALSFKTWSDNAGLHVRTEVGNTIEVMDATGRILWQTIAAQSETTFSTAHHGLVLVRVENQILKVIL